MKKKENKEGIKTCWRRHRLALSLLVVGLLMLILGLASGEYWNVFEKAITVCLDCLGIG